MASTRNTTPPVSADDALRRLIEGNERFCRGEAQFPTVQKDILADLAIGQSPYATILGCSDSRVPPELLFDAGFGELFVIRVAGNTLSAEVAGSMQYAATHLHTQLFVVLGHENCGAVQAAMATKVDGIRHKSRIQLLVDNIVPGLTDPDERLTPDAQLAHAVEENVRWTIRQIHQMPEAAARRTEGKMKLVGAVYDIGSGGVRFLPDDPEPSQRPR
ncbi:carbonic anhydrase [Humisphaera borealis]|uniref:carbonic anhydrase n=1 Tax=Humisphaera borealis TaxID=2807512 RepID=A0A7M2X0F8_9BACT|nr:carbonic anhydrase [Humisphaera borealis]QOV90571.1 carbonic anhydrase [Humisphaera borealis]